MASSFASLHATPEAELEVLRTLQRAERAGENGGPVASHAPANVRPAALRSKSTANPAALILGLQRTAGNAAVAQLLRASPARSVGVRGLSVQRSGDGGAQTDEEESVEPGQPLPTPIAGSEATGSALGGETATEAGDTATGGAQAEAGATGEQAGATGDQAGAGPDPASGASPDTGDSATGAAESAASDQGGISAAEGGQGESLAVDTRSEGADTAAEDGETGDQATGEAGTAAGAEGEQAASADGSADGEVADGEHSQEDQDSKQAEGESFTDVDERVPMEGGPPPASAVPTGRFIDGGRAATVPFESRTSTALDPADALVPHAYVGGGRTGDAAWAGGGPGRGPKGNQGTGSLQTELEPKYDTRSNGLTGDADAWVIAGTGVVDVKRDYIASNAGDQGNGWWISSKAAAALEAHEQRHVAAAKEDYDNKLQPMLDRVAKSATLGKGLNYWSSKATALLKQKIGWKYALEQFKEADQQSNANQGIVDLNDYGTSHYPRNMPGPRTIGGKQFENYLIMGDEPDPS